MNTEALSALVISALEEVKGQDIVCLDVQNLTPVTDTMIIATGTSSVHVKALADEVIDKVKEAKARVVGTEGRAQAEWVLVDLDAVLVHIMLAATRKLYNLEDLWDFDLVKGDLVKGDLVKGAGNENADGGSGEPESDAQGSSGTHG